MIIGGFIIKVSDYINCIENNKYKMIYQSLDEEFKGKIKKRQLKKIILKYKGHSHELFNQLELNDSIRYIYLSKDNNWGVAITIHKSTNKILGLLLLPLNKEQEQFFTDFNYFMPIDREWKVVWGGDTLITNYHSNIPAQKYAYDLLIEKENKTYLNDGTINEDYFAFEQTIVAPRSGVIVDVRNSVKDNQPGMMNENQVTGNYVIIRHGEQEYSLIAHFMHNSILVTPGQSVKTGDILGKCGNSGHSSEPHIHFQVMNTPLLSEDCLSKKIKFENLKDPIIGNVVPGQSEY